MSVFPNPIRGEASFEFDLDLAGRAQLEVFDVTGRRVRSWDARSFSAGRSALAWDGRDETGSRVPAGVYLVRVSADGRLGTRKVVVLK